MRTLTASMLILRFESFTMNNLPGFDSGNFAHRLNKFTDFRATKQR